MSRPHVVAPSELSALRDLELVARTTVEGLRQGLHRSPFHGYSAEFSQYRHYLPGDDLKYVDWKAFARTDRLYTRQFRETTNLAALFVVDVSRSMDFPLAGRPETPPGPSSRSGGALAPPASKFALAQAVTAVLGTLVIDQGDTAGLLAVADGVTYVPARSGRHHLHQFLATLARLQATGGASIGEALRRSATLLRRRGLVFVVSDFYEEGETLPEVQRLSRMGHDVIVAHVLAREELELDRVSAGEFVDLETGATLIVDPALAATPYREAFDEFLARIARAATLEGLDYLRLVTAAPLELTLRRFLVTRRGEA